ncbi:MAG TPA: hypothetical protein VGD22_07535 [Sphingobacteriaceae bacterium]
MATKVQISNNILLAFFSFLLLLGGTGCKSNRDPTREEEMFKSIYINQFRLTYFRQMLIKSYNNSEAVREIINNDNSGFTEKILTDEDYNLIDSLTAVDNNKMQIDSTKGNMRAEGAQGKRPLGFILDKIRSKWLDSLANERYEISGVKDFYY